MTVLLHIFLVVGASTLLALWCGWGLARLTLPASLKPWGGLLAPLLGYAVVLVAGFWGVRDWVSVPALLVVMLVATGLLNLLAWVRTGPPRLPQKPISHAPLATLLLATLLVGVAPLISYGHPAIIGDGWDVENYLPLARYLERGPVSAISSAPPNPLRDYNANPPKNGLTIGFSIWQAGVDTLTGQEAISTFAPLLAWLRMLGIVALYVLFRAILGLNRWYGLLGAAFVSAGGLLLWVEYSNFGMQISAWPLIPLGLVIGIAAVEEGAARGGRSWPVVVGAALSLAALPVAYYPALTLFAPLALGLGVAALLRSKRRVRLLGATAALAAATIVLSVPAITSYFEGFSYRYGEQLTTLGLFRYVPLTDFAGLTHFSLRGDPPVPPLAMVAFVCIGALMLVGLLWARKRLYWWGFALGGAAYMLWLWNQQYPYAWMKGGAYAAFPFLGLAAAGAQAIGPGRHTPIPPPNDEGQQTTDDYAKRNTQYEVLSRITHHASRPIAWAGTGIAVALLLLMGVTQAETVSNYWRQPALFAKELPDLFDLRGKIPAGSRVTVTSDPRINGVTSGLIAYMLDHATMLGHARTGYVPSWSNGEPDEVGEYGLLLAGEDPEGLGFGNGQAVWQGAGFTLWKRYKDTIAHLQMNRMLAPGDTLDIPYDDTHLGEGVAQNGERDTRSLTLGLAAFEPGSLSLDGQRVDVPPGGSAVIDEVVDTPHTLNLRNDGTTPVLVRWATLAMPYDVRQVEIAPQSNVVLAQAHAQAEGSVVTTTLDTISPGTGPVTLAIDIWDHQRGAHYGWYGVGHPQAEARHTITLTLDLPSGTMSGTDYAGAPTAIGGRSERLQRGDYTASLNLLAGTQLMTAPEEFFSFSIDSAGNASNVRVASTPLLATRAQPPVFVGVLEDQEGGVQLRGYHLDDSAARAGGSVAITLWWAAWGAKLDERSILIHLRDLNGEKRAQADGSPAGGGRPTSTWRGGETIIDQHTLQIPPDLPPGQYSIAVGMYHYPSLEPVQFHPLAAVEGDTLQKPWRFDGNVVLIPIEVKP
jgi:hypothetical protein